MDTSSATYVILRDTRELLLRCDYGALAEQHRSGKATLNCVGQLLSDVDSVVRENAAYTLGLIGRGDAEAVRDIVPQLVRLLTDESGAVGYNAFLALGMICQSDDMVAKSVFPILVALLDCDLVEARYNAARTVAAIGLVDEEMAILAVPKLVRLLDDDVTRRRAAQALAGLAEGDPKLVRSAVPRLAVLLDDPDPNMRYYAAATLGIAGMTSPLDSLHRLLADHSRAWSGVTIAEAAQEAISRIRRTSQYAGIVEEEAGDPVASSGFKESAGSVAESGAERKRSVYYCADLCLIHLKIGDLREALKYALDLNRYVCEEISDDLGSLINELEFRLKEGMSAGEECVSKAGVIVHQMRIGWG